ncbi:uncharacterized protein LAESUDRAFT_731252 [Laetiporus sulphureus 93-53]|uniref:Uncharacterized protein n=1 Tax=Laetiporus sulphureus 93-53 TaxID=1314785 RepID=A0A165BNZ8_9APHY|nr:uncharacterized protein LAESUDRAFT_731252 [Laetiporus sulphureus 93-53]KZT01393.1 hypothetical protein LAESUDRAFT_731252 [Laetiporus sulphureus 93-53]
MFQPSMLSTSTAFLQAPTPDHNNEPELQIDEDATYVDSLDDTEQALLQTEKESLSTRRRGITPRLLAAARYILHASFSALVSCASMLFGYYGVGRSGHAFIITGWTVFRASLGGLVLGSLGWLVIALAHHLKDHLDGRPSDVSIPMADDSDHRGSAKWFALAGPPSFFGYALGTAILRIVHASHPDLFPYPVIVGIIGTVLLLLFCMFGLIAFAIMTWLIV